MSFIKAVLALACALALSAPASADILRFTSNTDAQVFPNVALTDVDLNGTAAGVQGTSFVTTADSTLVIVTFMAECSIAGDFSSWVNIDLAIKRPTDANFVTLAPTNSDNAFCAGGSNAQDNWVSAVTAGALRVPAGNHQVRVQVSRGFTSGEGTNSIRLDDVFLYVQN